MDAVFIATNQRSKILAPTEADMRTRLADVKGRWVVTRWRNGETEKIGVAKMTDDGFMFARADHAKN